MYQEFTIEILSNGAVIVSLGERDFGRKNGKIVAYEDPAKAKAWLLSRVEEVFDTAMVAKGA